MWNNLLTITLLLLTTYFNWLEYRHWAAPNSVTADTLQPFHPYNHSHLVVMQQYSSGPKLNEHLARKWIKRELSLYLERGHNSFSGILKQVFIWPRRVFLTQLGSQVIVEAKPDNPLSHCEQILVGPGISQLWKLNQDTPFPYNSRIGKPFLRFYKIPCKKNVPEIHRIAVHGRSLIESCFVCLFWRFGSGSLPGVNTERERLHRPWQKQVSRSTAFSTVNLHSLCCKVWRMYSSQDNNPSTKYRCITHILLHCFATLQGIFVSTVYLVTEISISTSRPSFTQRPASYSAGHPMPNN